MQLTLKPSRSKAGCVEKAMESLEGPTLPKTRDSEPLFSELYAILDQPISHPILEEFRYVQNWTTARHHAIKGLIHNKLLGFKGTPFANKCWDIDGLI